MKILGICGSFREDSANAYLLKAARECLSAHEWTTLDLSTLPYFDPDHQFTRTPDSVTKARQLACDADLIFVTTPEYAHGIPGILKNGFEWIFHEGTQRKPVTLVIGAAQGEFAQAQLVEVLSTMDFVIGIENTLLIRGARSKVNSNGSFKVEADRLEFNQFCQKALNRNQD